MARPGIEPRNPYSTSQVLPQCGIRFLVDFEKAFDSVPWKIVYKYLKFFNFGPDFIRWIHIMNDDTQLCVIQNGFFSQFFGIGRGCRQGDPTSPYIVNLCVEILAILFRHNADIKGIKIGKTEYSILQYADDTVIFLDGSEKKFEKLSGPLISIF